MRSHNADDAASSGIQSSRNDTENNIFASEDTSNSRMSTWCSSSGVLHNTDGSRSPLLHQPRSLPDGSLGPDSCRLCAGIHNSGKVGERCLLAEFLDPGKHGGCLRVGVHTSEFGLDTSHGAEELLRRRGASLDLAESFMEDLGNIEETDNVSVFIANGLNGVDEDSAGVYRTRNSPSDGSDAKP